MTTIEEKLAALRAKKEKGKLGGGEKRIEAQHAKGSSLRVKESRNFLTAAALKRSTLSAAQTARMRLSATA